MRTLSAKDSTGYRGGVMTEVRSGRIGRWLDRVYADNDFESVGA